MAEPAPLLQVLTSRELEVASWVSEGLSNRDIGIIMGLTENTVKKYLMRIFERTGCDNRVVLAIRFAREHTGLFGSSGSSGSGVVDA
jgi:DNA-binding CsgD family transcriptional regulator